MRSRRRRVIVAIDGPAGSGKSTTAREVARRVGFRHLDSGAFYRALTLAALRAGWPPEGWARLTDDQLDSAAIRSEPAGGGFRLYAGDDDVTDQLRSADVNAHVSRMAAVPAVREWLFGELRGAAASTDLVADGRDMGTVVFPDAELKVFLTAELETRARRRLEQEGRTAISDADVEDEIRRIAARDRVDSEREHSPLRRADDAVDVDTTKLGFDEQVDRIVELIRERQPRSVQ